MKGGEERGCSVCVDVSGGVVEVREGTTVEVVPSTPAKEEKEIIKFLNTFSARQPLTDLHGDQWHAALSAGQSIGSEDTGRRELGYLVVVGRSTVPQVDLDPAGRGVWLVHAQNVPLLHWKGREGYVLEDIEAVGADDRRL